MELMLTKHVLIKTMWIRLYLGMLMQLMLIETMLIQIMLIEIMLIDIMLIEIMLVKIMLIKIMLIQIIFDRTGVLIMLNTPLAGDRTGVRSVAGSVFIYNVTKNSARPRFDFNMCTRGANSSRKVVH